MSRKDKRTDGLGLDEIISLSFDAVFTEILNNEDKIIVLENILSIYFKESLDNYKKINLETYLLKGLELIK